MWWPRQPKPGTRRAPAQRPVAEVLEPRILYSADIAAGLALGAATQDAGAPDAAQQRTLDANGEYVQVAAVAAPSAAPSVDAAPAAAPAPAADAGPSANAAPAANAAPSSSAVAVAYATSALNFEANVGQAAASVDFLARGSGYEIALAQGGAQITLAAGGMQQAVGLSLAGSSSAVTADPQGLLEARSNYLLGNDASAWRTGIANYGAVVYHGVYDGIDVRYYGTQRQLEYDFMVAAGADAGQIRLAFSGVAAASIDASGDLVLALQGSDQRVSFKAPVSWQEGANGTREAVQSAYVIHADGTIGFALGEWDHARALVIDPILNYASYFGGSGTENGQGVAIGADGSVYITGRTTASLSDSNSLGGGGGAGDVYVAKFNADLSTLIWSTRIGGSGDEQANAIAVDASGNASVTGWTRSANFPTASAVQASRSGTQDAFVLRLNASGTALGFSTYFGGTGSTDTGNAITVDASGNVYAAGQASAGLGMSGINLLGGLLGGLLGSSDDAFVAKFSTAGAMQYGSLYGGGATDAVNGIAVDAAGNAYIAGATASNDLTTVNAQDATYGGAGDGFLAKLSANGGTILYSSYLGSSREDVGVAIALDSAGKVYVTGTTNVNGSTDFQVTAGALQTTAANGVQGFVRVYDLSLGGSAALVYSSFLGGTVNNLSTLPTGIGIDGLGRIVIAGQTTATNLPTTADAAQSFNTGTALFLVIIKPQANGAGDLAYGTYYGIGMTAGALAVSGTQAYLIGNTSTGGLATPGADRTSPAGNADALVAGFSLYNAAPVLSGANAMGTLLEDPLLNFGSAVSSLIAGTVTDGNAGALKGVAITGVDAGSGSWEYSLNAGFTWSAIVAPSATSALLLAADVFTRVRFVPGANFAGTVVSGLTLRAWDRSTGTAGTYVDTSVNGGQTAFSTATAASSVTVTAVNDAPVRTAGSTSNLTVLEDAGATSLGLAGLTYGPGGGADEAGQTLGYTVTALPSSLGQIVLANGTTVVLVGNSYSLAQLRGMQFIATANAFGGPATFSWNVVDSGGTSNGGDNTLSESLTITVTAVNDAPVQTAGSINNLTVLEDASVTSLGLGALAYSAGPGEGAQALTYTVTGVPDPLLGRIVLADGATTVAAGTAYSLVQLRGMQFRAVADANGGPATFSWNVTDDGGTANGGVNTLSQSLTVSVTPVNDAPVRTGGSVTNLTVLEDAPTTGLGLGGLAYSVGPGETGQTLTYTVTAIPTATLGQVVLADGATVVAAGTPYSLAQLQGMQFKAAANANGGPATFSWSVTDSGGTANGGVNTLSQSLTISVTAVNDAPVQTAGAINNLTVLEDAGTTSLGLGALAYSAGPGEGTQVLAYTVTAVPDPLLGRIVLADGTTTVAAGTAYSLAQLQGVQFRAVANANGGPASFSWSVTDNGGTANGGVNTLSQSLGISVTAVNDAPVQTAGSINNLTVLEDAGATSLGLGALAYSPGAGEGGQVLTYAVTAVPAASLGSIVLADGTTLVAAGTPYSLAQLRGMQFKAVANANGGPATFSWSVTDDGGTANGGVNTLSQSLTVSVTAVNDAPVQTAGTISNLSVLEDSGTSSLGLGGLAYNSGPGDTGQSLSYTVTAVPSALLGSIVLADGATPVTAGTAYSLVQLRGMQFKAVANANGGPSTFSWSVQDDGGTANGGVNTLSQSLAISVTAVNDAPVQTGGSINNLSVLEDASATSLGLGGLAYSAGPGEAGQGISYTVTAVPSASLGQILLADGTTPVSAGSPYSLTQLQGMQFKAAANANGGPATFSWSVTDNGGTANGGVDTLSQSLTVSVTAVNDAPVQTAGAVNDLTVPEDSGTTTLGLAGLAYSVGPGESGQSLSYSVTAVPNPLLGSIVLADGTTPVTAGTAYSLVQLQGMQFKAVANANGGPATFNWSVTDSGGTANGGVDTLSQGLFINVTPVNDAPVLTAGSINNLTVLEDAPATSLGLGGLAYSAGPGEAGQGLVYAVTAVPAAGLGQITLADGTTLVAAGTSYSLAQLQGMQFKAAANANGGPATFSWCVQDNGGTANGGVDMLTQSLTISVTAVNDAPLLTAGVISDLSVLEDAPATSLGLGGLAYSAGPGDTGQSLIYTVTAVPAGTLGQILLADGATLVTAGTPYTLAQLQGMQFKAAANASGGPAMFSWSVQDNGGTTNGGSDTLAQGLALSVTAVNDAPVQTGGAITDLSVLENSAATSLGLAGLSYGPGGGADEAGQSLAYKVAAVPSASLGRIVLADGTTLVTAGATYSLAQLQGMMFVAAFNANGGPDTFSWTVTDSGGTANGGVDTLTQSLDILITTTNQAPVLAGVNPLAGILEDATSNDGTLVSALVAAQITDGNANAAVGIAVTAADNTNGVWQFSRNGGDSWTAFGAVSDTSATLLSANSNTRIRFVPNADWNGSLPGGLTLRAWDRTTGTAGGSADTTVNGGATAFSTATASTGIVVTAVNDAPVRTGASVSNLTVLEDAPVTSLGLSALAYSPGAGPGEAGQALGYTVTAVPSASLGQIVLADGTTPVAAGTSWSLAQLQGMQFKAAADANGGAATFSWRVKDNGGTANGGEDTLDQSLTVSVTAVNDAPVKSAGAINNLTVLEDAPLTSLGLAGLVYAAGPSNESAQSLVYTVTAVPSASLGQVVLANGTTGVTAGTAYALSDLRGMQFKAAANANGGPATFSWSVTDNGGTANGGVNTLAQSLTISVTAVNDAPVETAGSINNLTVLEDAAATSLGLGGLAYSAGPGEAGQTLAYTVTAVPSASLGQIVLADGATLVGAGTAWSLAQLQGMQFKAAANANGGPASFSWSVTDNGGTANGGVDTLSQSLTISVSAVNDAPVQAAGSINNLTVLEDAPATSLGLAGLAYSAGPGEAGQSLSYTVTAVPAASLGQIMLADGTTPVTAGTPYSLVQLQGMQFMAAGHASGGPVTFSWTVQDDGGTADGGANTLAQSLTISVTAVNDAPVQTAGSITNLTVLEDAPATSLGLSALAYSAGPGEAGQALAYTVTAVPLASLGQIVLADGATLVGAGTAWSLAQLQGMQFKAAADASGGPATFSWSVQDNGGTANGGADTLSQSLTISVSAVNDAPVQTAGSINNLTVLEDAPATSLGLAGLAYSAGPGESGQSLSYTVTAVPAASLGQIMLADGTTPVTAGTPYSLVQLQGMQFMAAGNASGGPATFSWSVTDDGGTANGGVNTLTQSLSLSVTAVNDAPVQTAGSINNLTVLEDAGPSSLGLGGLAYSAGGGADEASQTLGYTVTTVPAAALGSVVLADGTTAVLAGSSYSLADLQGMKFVAAANASGGPTTFSWRVMDNAGTANGGADTLTQSLTISVTAVNDAPVQTAGSINNLAVLEDAGATSLGLGGLAYSPGGSADEAGQGLSYTVSAVPAATLGSVVLADGSTLVVAGANYSLAELQGMKFLATPHANGGPATFSWSVTDDGGTANGGVNTLTQSLSLSVTAVNDAPVQTAGSINNLTVLEDAGPSSLGLGGLAYSAGGGADEASQTLGYTVTTVPAAALGSVVLADGTTAVLAGSSYSLADLQGMKFVAAANASGGPATFSWRVMDNAGTANGGADTLTQSLTISVTAVNDAPVQTAGSINPLAVLEDAGATSLGLGGLAYSPGGSADEAGQGLSYTVSAVPAATLGSVVLADGSTLVVAGANYSLAELQGMKFVATTNASGGPATFSWSVTDDGGTANGGANTLTQSLTISVTAVNDAPAQIAGNISALTVLEDAGATTLGLGDLAYSPGSGSDDAAQTLTYTVTAVPTAALGSVVLADGTTRVLAGASYSLADLQGMKFLAAPNANGGPASFSWNVQDNAGTANGGADTLTQSLTITVTAVNDAPVQTAGTLGSLSITQDAPATSLGLQGLLYSPGGGADEAGQLLSYTVTAVPDAQLGSIVLGDGTLAGVGGSYTLAQLQGAQFAASGTIGGPASFSWVVADNQGVANGGADRLDQGITVSITAAPPAPAPAPAPATPAAPPAAPLPAPAPVEATAPAPGAPEAILPVTPAAPAAPATAPATASPAAPQAAVAPAAAAAAAQAASTGASASTDAAAALDDSQRQLAQGLGVAPLQDFSRPANGLLSFAIQPVVVPTLTLDRRDLGLPQQPQAEDAGATQFDVRGQGASASSGDAQRTLRSPVFIEEMDKMREDVRKELNLDKTVALSAGAVSFGVSLIYVLWLIRGGVLMGSYLSAMPAWRVLDPLPVLPNSGGGTDEDDDSLEAAVDDPGDPLHSLRGY